MLDNKGFDLWANNYDKTVGISNDNNTYPFAGYKNILNQIYNDILNSSAEKVLDVGFGTGVLTYKLYEEGITIYGQDFSKNMIDLAKSKMPKAHLYEYDFTYGLIQELKDQKYDAVIATYSLHHLNDKEKEKFIKNSIFPVLKNNGILYIGDVAFKSRAELENYKQQNISIWDNDEVYWVYDEIRDKFKKCIFKKYSECSGIIKIWNDELGVTIDQLANQNEGEI